MVTTFARNSPYREINSTNTAFIHLLLERYLHSSEPLRRRLAQMKNCIGFA
ncbi:hypothetical protein yberc0001_21000 [Yersinia bercovieri ATCC 43970]|uniref:Uncharacterized protein n=1 Tax=Yersinia bercovieri ATCC 43970 TaxID=349968 RepID=A0ABP2DYE9_YERBE|nr:hypothetical protein yberc0001_21000 [Yersinia bercovieri ATCC 43970]